MQHTHSLAITSIAPEHCSEHRTVASYEHELERYRRAELQLREIIAFDDNLLRQKDETIKYQVLLSSESTHRLLNDLQMIVSLLSLQSRAAANTEAATQLASAADRVVMIGRMHRRLHSLDAVRTVAFKQFLEDICRDFSTMLSAGQDVIVEGIEITLPAIIAVPLGFIANELITNAAKHGTGRITVSLKSTSARRYALSVSNDGPGLPDGFDPANSRGLGMRIIRSFVKQIGGEMRNGKDCRNQGTQFTVLFSGLCRM